MSGQSRVNGSHGSPMPRSIPQSTVKFSKNVSFDWFPHVNRYGYRVTRLSFRVIGTAHSSNRFASTRELVTGTPLAGEPSGLPDSADKP